MSEGRAPLCRERGESSPLPTSVTSQPPMTGFVPPTDSGSAAAHQPGTLRNASHWQEEQPRRTALLAGRVSVAGGQQARSSSSRPSPHLLFHPLSCCRADEDNESSSSEDEDDDRRCLSDELLGKVCSIEAEEDPARWYLALVGVHRLPLDEGGRSSPAGF